MGGYLVQGTLPEISPRGVGSFACLRWQAGQRTVRDLGETCGALNQTTLLVGYLFSHLDLAAVDCSLVMAPGPVFLLAAYVAALDARPYSHQFPMSEPVATHSIDRRGVLPITAAYPIQLYSSALSISA